MTNQASLLSSAAPDFLFPWGERALRTRHGGLACYRHVVARGQRSGTCAGQRARLLLEWTAP
ncbi:hypothetical protein XCR_4541 [Xanthomonas campestris pv. raphani 756C]|nr:hypothetical protein XCR_4541 [Xanthomonas campestris pv. raphani 756C]